MSETMPLTLTLRTARSVAAVSLLCLLLGVLVVTQPAAAQVLYGSITGMVTDPSGASLPKATVQALNTGTGTVKSMPTDDRGAYLFTNLLPGTYTMSVTAPGFAKYMQESVTLLANQQRRVDVTLALSQASEHVEVVASAIALQADRADVNTQLETKQLNDLPITGSAGRNFQSLYKFVPGFSLVTEGVSSDGGNPQRTMTGNVNGNSMQANVTRIDGSSNTYMWLPFNSAYVPPTESIQSVSIVTNSYDAEQGNANGASVNVITKSGTNQFHGSAFEDHTDKALKALNRFQTVGVAKPQYIFNQYGGAVGGPIKKNKLFFFADWEGTKRRMVSSATKTVINPAGVFDGSGNANLASGITNATTCAGCIFDPSTGNADGSGRTQFVGNIIPVSRIDPAAKNMLGLISTGHFLNTAGANASNNYLAGGSTQMNRDTIDSKVDYVPSDKLSIFGRYSISIANFVDPPVLGKAMGGASGGGQVGAAPSRIQNVGMGGTYTVSPNLLIDGNAGFLRQRLGATYAPDLDLGNYGIDALHIPGTNGSSYLEQGTPAFSPTGWNGIGNVDTGNPFLFRDNQYVANLNLSWLKGSHSVRWGIAFTDSQMNHYQPQGGSFGTPRGSFQFLGSVTALKGGAAATPANSLAQFLLGLPDRVGRVAPLANPNALRWKTWAGYIRDAWQVTPKLTLTYGVRWEYYPMAYSDHGGAKLFDPSTGNVLIGGYGSTPVDDGVDVGHGQFVPRFGIAYRLDSKTVIRAGYGMSADNNNWRFFRNNWPAVANADVQGASSFYPAASLTGEALSPYPGLRVGIPLVAFPDITSGSIPLPNNVGIGGATIPFKYNRGYVHSYNFTVQREFMSGLVAEVGYVGTRGIRTLTNENINAAPINGGNPGRVFFAKYQKNWGDMNCLCPDTNSYYDGVQTKVTWRLKDGNQFGLNYTYSKAINSDDNEEVSGTFGTDGGFLFWAYPDYRSRNKALASYDRPHNLQAYGIYSLPLGKNKRWANNGLASKVAGGWQLNWVVSRLSGNPMTLKGGGSQVNAPGNYQTPDQWGPVEFLGGVGPVLVSGQANPCATNTSNSNALGCQHYWNPATGPGGSATFLAVPGSQIRFGTMGRNNLRGPGFFNLDTSIFRDFSITESVKLQIKAEMFGVTNTPHLGNPGVDVSNLAQFGVITSTLNTAGRGTATGGERQTWFSAKFTF